MNLLAVSIRENSTFDFDYFRGGLPGNNNALDFWGLSEVQELIDKDLSEDTEGARKRTEQTFVKAALEKVTSDPWTTYPNGQPKVMLMRHVAVLLGEEQHRGIIAFISEQMDTNAQPENLLFAEAVRYTSVTVSCFDMQGKRLFENPAFTAFYGNEVASDDEMGSDFISRFSVPQQGQDRLSLAKAQQDGHQEHVMVTKQGEKRLNVDIRTSRHPLTGDYVFLVTEYDVTKLYNTIGELEQTKEELKKLAHYDSLTKLPSTWLVKERLSLALLQAKRETSAVGVMFMDLDGFKAVNDSLGHCAGDNLLVQVAQRLGDIFRDTDTVGRIGGDEFLICLPNLSTHKAAESLAKKVIDEVAKPFQIKAGDSMPHWVNISASVGISFYPQSAIEAERLIQLADEKMYQAKMLGKNQYAF
ncbi:sensor domain-containing diguanylate cyclase [Psychrobium sp. 1_MG-2023]|nr:sensor domain-containing diguanylate cyclase [Psychrobium sp. 1_MG-2023]MDP2562792.1 sensor domain-containing diguanylate cyclase [Psychrobium sp. 1_MG-2023]